MGHLSAEYVHTVIECAKLAFADREAWYGDPAFADVPLDDAARAAATPTSAARWSARRRRSSCVRAPRTAASRGWRTCPPPSRSRAGFGVGEPTLGGRGDGPIEGDTCHVDVVDRHGNMVSATPSGGWLHASPAIPGLGLCLGTRAQMFWLEEGLPNSLEPRQAAAHDADAVARRCATARPSWRWARPGGDQQDQWSLQFFLSHLDFGLNLQEAIDAPAFTLDALPVLVLPARVRARARRDRGADRRRR